MKRSLKKNAGWGGGYRRISQWGISPFDHLPKVHQLLIPKLGLITLSPPETAGYQVGRIYGCPDLSKSKRLHFLGIPGRVFSSSTWGKSEKVYCGGCGTRTHDPEKKHGLSTTAFVEELVGYQSV